MLTKALASSNQFFFDPEYYEDFSGGKVSYELISIGIVPVYTWMPNFYAISEDFNPARAPAGSFVDGIVLPRLELTPEEEETLASPRIHMPFNQIAKAIADYLGPYEEATMWSYRSERDYIVMRSIFGDEPQGSLMHKFGCKKTIFADLEHLIVELEAEDIPSRGSKRDNLRKHNGLRDAMWHRDVFWHLQKKYHLKPELKDVKHQPETESSTTSLPVLQPEM